MNRAAILLASAALFAYRAYRTYGLFGYHSAAGVVIGFSSVWVLVTTALAWCIGKPDVSWRGVVVGLCYLPVLLLRPAGSGFAALLVLLFWCQVCLRFQLLHRCTITGPVFVSVVRRGPYAVVRHPLTLLELCTALVVVLACPTFWNWSVLFLVVLCKILMTLLEEQFLMMFYDYRSYASRVRWRWVPLLW
jgi:protein-S-isoprenylcysteine O-methyltransferase Ste14